MGPMDKLSGLGPLAQLRAPRLPRRLVQLFAGLALYGFSMGLLVRSTLGLDPWDVFHEGVAKRTDRAWDHSEGRPVTWPSRGEKKRPGLLGQYLMGVQNQMALVAGAVMGIMLIPLVSSLSDDILNAVPQSLRDGSYAMGATKSETVKKVVLPAALPGIMAAMLLAVSRAVGETMIVTMAAGLQAKLTANPLDTVTTVTVQIVTLLTGDQEFDSPKTLSAFGLGLTLFVVTLCLNIIALRIVQKYREQYD